MQKCGPMSDLNDFHLRCLLLGGNDISIFELKHLHKTVVDRKVPLFVDSFERISRNGDSCLFLSEINTKTLTEDKLIGKLQKNIKNVIVKEVMIGTGKKTKKTKAG